MMDEPIPFDNPTELAARFAEGSAHDRAEIFVALEGKDAIFGVQFSNNLDLESQAVLLDMKARHEGELENQARLLDPVFQAIEDVRQQYNNELGEKHEQQYLTIQLHARLMMITGLASEIVTTATALGLPQKAVKPLGTASRYLRQALDTSFERVNAFMEEGMMPDIVRGRGQRS